jgi:hypothetical protein
MTESIRNHKRGHRGDARKGEAERQQRKVEK